MMIQVFRNYKYIHICYCTNPAYHILIGKSINIVFELFSVVEKMAYLNYPWRSWCYHLFNCVETIYFYWMCVGRLRTSIHSETNTCPLDT